MPGDKTYEEHELEYQSHLSRTRSILASPASRSSRSTLLDGRRYLRNANRCLESMRTLAELEGHGLNVAEAKGKVEKEVAPLRAELERALTALQAGGGTCGGGGRGGGGGGFGDGSERGVGRGTGRGGFGEYLGNLTGGSGGGSGGLGGDDSSSSGAYAPPSSAFKSGIAGLGSSLMGDGGGGAGGIGTSEYDDDNDDENPLYGGGGDTGEENVTEQLIRSSEHLLRESAAICADTEQVGAETLLTMGGQREQLEMAGSRVRDTRAKMDEARRVLRDMSRRAIRNKLFLYGVIAILILANLGVMYHLWTRGKK